MLTMAAANAATEKLAGKLALEAAETGIKGFVSKILKLIKEKGLTLEKVLAIYVIVNDAYENIAEILADKKA